MAGGGGGGVVGGNLTLMGILVQSLITVLDVMVQFKLYSPTSTLPCGVLQM